MGKALICSEVYRYYHLGLYHARYTAISTAKSVYLGLCKVHSEWVAKTLIDFVECNSRNSAL